MPLHSRSSGILRWLALLLVALLGLGSAWAQPNVTLSVTPPTAEVGQAFTASYDIPADPAERGFYLDWGDGSRTPLPPGPGSQSHVYRDPGSYTVVLGINEVAFARAAIRVTQATTCTLSADPNPAQPAQNVTFSASFSGGAGGHYLLSFGDGIDVALSVSRTGTASATHSYARPGSYVAIVTDQETQRPLCQLSVTVRAPTLTLSLNPNPANVGEQVTASAGNLLAGVAYTLDWGDGSRVPVSGNGNATFQHAYQAPGVYVVTLGAEGTPPATASLTVRAPAPTLSLSPNPANVGEQVTATAGNLLSGVAYTLNWGDGSSSPLSGNGSASLKHSYQAPGVYVVTLGAEGVPPATASLTVRAPALSLDVSPNPAHVGEQVSAVPGGLLPGRAYSLDWGDGSTAPIGGPLRHAYAAPGTYLLRLTGEGVAPATATLRVESALDVQNLRLRFTRPADQQSPVVVQGTRLDAALELEYSGQGSIQGSVTLDGQTIAQVSLTARPGGGTVSFPIPQLPTSDIGTHQLVYQPAPPAGQAPVFSTPPSLSYRVRALPTELEIAGFVFRITGLDSADPQDFTGRASHTLLVGGVEAFKDVAVSFAHLKVVDASETRVRVTDGGFSMNLRGFKSTPLPAGLTGFTLLPYAVDFTPSAATFSGGVSLAITCAPPDPKDKLKLHQYLEERPFLNPLINQGAAQQLVSSRTLPLLSTGGAADLSSEPGHSSDLRFQGLGGAKGAAPFPTAGVKLAASTPVALSSRFTQVSSAALQAISAMCRPDPQQTYSVSGSLKPDSGDLFGSAQVTLSPLSVPSTPLYLSGAVTLTLDLSAAQSDSHIADVAPAYALAPSIPAPPQDGSWMGVVLGGAKATLGPPDQRTFSGGGRGSLTLQVSLPPTLPPTTVTLRSGYTLLNSLAGGSFTDRGWTFTLKELKLAVVENSLVQGEGGATARIPMFEETADVNVTTADGRLTYALAGPLKHDFGASELSAGGGLWVERGQALDLHLSGAAWDLRELSKLKAASAGGGTHKFGDLAAKGGLSKLALAGNVPAVAGGQSLSLVLSNQVSMQATSLASDLLKSGGSGGGATSGGTGSSTGASGGELRLSDPQLGGRLKLDGATYQDGVASLPTLVFVAEGGVSFGGGLVQAAPSSDGLSRAPLGIPDFKMLGQSFNVKWVVIGRQGSAYALGLDGGQKLSPQLPVVPTTLRYRVQGGRNLSLTLHTDGFRRRLDPNTAITVDASDSSVTFSGSSMWPSLTRTAGLTAGGNAPSVGLHPVPGGYQLDIAGGLDMGQGDSAFAVKAEASFGLTDDPYFYVKASVQSRTPLITVLGAFNVYSFTGGVAYNMAWPDRATIPEYAKPPVYSHDHRVQIIGGMVAAFEDGNSLHLSAIFKVDTQRGFELTADGWILTPMNQGVFGNQAAQGRILASVTSDGFDMMGCLGPATVAGLKCSDLRRFTFAGGLVELNAWFHVRIADQKFVKIGTYGNPVTAQLNVPVLGGVSSQSYLIVGQAFEDGDRKDNLKGTGIFIGERISTRLGAAGALGKIGWPLNCYPWARARFDYYMSLDAGLQFDPVAFDAAAEFSVSLDLRAGCAGRDRPFANQQEIMNWNGKSVGLGLNADIKGHLQAFDPFAFNGSASLRVDIPVIPTFTVTASVSF